MPRLEEQIEISVARPQLFKFCHDAKKRPEWDEQIERMEILSPGPLRQGVLIRVDARQGNSVFSWDGEVSTYQFPQRSRMQILDPAKTSPFGRGSEFIWDFDAMGSDTKVTWVWDYKPNGFIARILDALGRQIAIRRTMKRSLANLKEMAESGRRAGF